MGLEYSTEKHLSYKKSWNLFQIFAQTKIKIKKGNIEKHLWIFMGKLTPHKYQIQKLKINDKQIDLEEISLTILKINIEQWL